MIQSQIVSYWQAKQKLPSSLADLTDPIAGFTAPGDPQTAAPYEYAVKGSLAFELCANFNAPARPYSIAVRSVPAAPVGYPAKSSAKDVWQHGAGPLCFERTIDPQLYPPVKR